MNHDELKPREEFTQRMDWWMESALRRQSRASSPGPGRRRFGLQSVAVGVLCMAAGAQGMHVVDQRAEQRQGALARFELERKIETGSHRVLMLEGQEERARLLHEEGLTSNAELQRAVQTVAEARRSQLASQLDLEEVTASGWVPNPAIWAPLVDGRDFVRERLELERVGVQESLDFETTSLERVRIQREAAIVSAAEFEKVEARVEVLRIRASALDAGIGLRLRFSAGELSASEVHWQHEFTLAESALAAANADVASRRNEAERARVHAKSGIASQGSVDSAEWALREAEGRATLASRMIEWLQRERDR